MSAEGTLGRRVAVFGDSIAEGLGARGRPFPILVADDLNAELVDLSETARQVTDSLRLIEKARGCEIVVIAHGATEALWRPTDAALRLVPARWRRPGWLDPRPYFSSRRPRRLGQRAESALRWRLKLVLMRVFGSVQWLPAAEYEQTLTELVECLHDSRVVVLSTLAVDDRFFPGSAAELERYSRINRETALAAGALFVDVSGACRRWSDYLADHFHPDAEGHRRIATMLLEGMSAGSGG